MSTITPLLVSVFPKIIELGLFSEVSIIKTVNNEIKTKEFENEKRMLFHKMFEDYSSFSFEDDGILQGYRAARNKLESPGNKFAPSPEKLIKLLLKRSSLPSINLLVDICNSISLESRLSIGIHQLDKIGRNLTLRLTQGDELFIPLGSKKPDKIKKGEFAYIDGNNNILCRYDSVQCDRTKVSETTNSVVVIVQGNMNTTQEYVDNAMEKILIQIEKYTGINSIKTPIINYE